ncbi:hypothetical protein ACTFIR_012096 [Dictyostelium discoideum]
MISSFGIEEEAYSMNKNIEYFKRKSESSIKETIKKEELNGRPEIKLIIIENLRFVDISNIRSDKNKLEYITKNIGYLEDYDGFVLYKEISLEKFQNINISNHAYLIEGMVIINKLNEFDLHATTVTFINCLITNYCLVDGILTNIGGCNIIIGPNSFQCPDGQIVRRFPNNKALLFVHEINYRSMKLKQALIKIRRYFQIPSCNVALLIHVYDRDPLYCNRFKAVALFFERVNSIVYPSYVVSFGTQQLTNNDVDNFNHLTNHSPITGCLSNNNIVNDELNNPIFILNITPQILYHPNVPPDNVGPLVIDLFRVKEQIDLVEHFSSSVN